MTHNAECGPPEQYGIQVLVAADSRTAYWRFDEDYPLCDSEEGARGDLADALGYGHPPEHLRVVAVYVIPPGSSDS